MVLFFTEEKHIFIPELLVSPENIDLSILASDLSFWHKTEDLSKNPAIKCLAYRMKDGLCLRTNNILTYCEANRRVSSL